MDKRQRQQWSPPEPTTEKLPELYLYNSLTCKKERFIPQDGMNVSWYSCGPTVYDSSHMGHARTYIAFDILRRTMQDYFNFKVNYVMNITDVDDKIIKRARQRHLFEQFKKESHSFDEIKGYLSRGVEAMLAKSTTDPEPEKRVYFAQEHERLNSLLASVKPETHSVSQLLQEAADAISELVDKERASTISEFKIFETLTKYYETEFHEDMKALNVLPPNQLVRVSEYIPPIIEFIEQIIENGFAYAVESGSVYFNTNKFEQDSRHFYAKLVPTAFGDANKLATGEGDLNIAGEKLNPSDFALWKNSKPGEPSWDSPWGKGRPGWHIECSAMATGCLGESMDIHSGGVDLKFPHHDNELAQSEAYHGHSHWVRYFLHSGHLTIDGCKMSKSLKNFITIRQALTQHSARQLRMAFLLHAWKDTLDYGANTMAEAISLDKAFYDFTFSVSYLVFLALNQPATNSSSASAYVDSCPDYADAIDKCKSAIFASLCDSIDTRGAIWALRELIDACNALQMKEPLTSEHKYLRPIAEQLLQASALILRLLRMFGAGEVTILSTGRVPLPEDSSQVKLPKSIDELPWISMDACGVEKMKLVFDGCRGAAASFLEEISAVKDETVEEIVAGFKKVEVDTLKEEKEGEKMWPMVAMELHRLAQFRQNIRAYAQTLQGDTKKKLLIACDKLRDQFLPPLGVRLQDRVMGNDASRPDVPAIGLIDPGYFMDDEKDKKTKDKEKAAKQAAKDEVAKIPPQEMFLQEKDQYSRWDDKGLPTHDAEGKELTKSSLKKLQKAYDAQAKKHEAYLKSRSNS